MTFPEIQISFDAIAVIAAIGTALVFIWRKALLPTIRLVRKLFKELDGMEDTKSKIASIYSELHPNGGSSIRDAVNRIESRMVAVEQRQNIYLLEAPQGIYETNSEGKCIGVNRTYCRMLGRTEKEILGMGWLNGIAEYDRDRVLDDWNNAIQQKIEFICKYDMIDSDGYIFSVDGIAYPMENPNNHNTIGWIGTIVMNVNEKKKNNNNEATQVTNS